MPSLKKDCCDNDLAAICLQRNVYSKKIGDFASEFLENIKKRFLGTTCMVMYVANLLLHLIVQPVVQWLSLTIGVLARKLY